MSHFNTRHHLINIDAVARRADCSLCGIDSHIHMVKGNLLCGAQRRYATGKGKLRLTYKEIDELKRNNSSCAICGITFELPINTHVDHDHETMEYRGILCRKCNNGLGFFKDDPNILAAAIIYLENNGKEITEWVYTAKIGQASRVGNHPLRD